MVDNNDNGLSMEMIGDNNQVVEWFEGGNWLGKINYIHDNKKWGKITIYGDENVLNYPEKRQKVDDLWFSVQDEQVEEGDLVMFEIEDAPPGIKIEKDNIYQMQVVKDSLKKVKEIPEIPKQLSEICDDIYTDLVSNNLQCLRPFGRQLIITDYYSDELEKRIRYEVKSRLENWEQELEDWEQELEDKEQSYTEEIEREKEKLIKQKKEIEEASQKIAELEERKKEIQIYEDDVNKKLQKWGFQSMSEEDNHESKEFLNFDTEHDLIDIICDRITSQGFSYSREQIINFYTCLKTDALVILAGLSGSGKSSLVRLFADAINAQHKPIFVKATWNDDVDLLGFYHPEKKTYISEKFLDVIVQANANEDKLYLICLEEMNLSRVEYYFSEFLSIMELEDRSLELYSKLEWETQINSLDKLKTELNNGNKTLEEYNQKEKKVRAYKYKVPVPHNIFIIGTVNVDETTHPFSNKVLDRSQIIQFESVPFENLPPNPKEKSLPTHLSSQKFLEFKQSAESKYIKQDNKQLYEWMNKMNEVLKRGGFQFGHRVKHQIESYYKYAYHSGLGDNNDKDGILDIQVCQKILPKIKGLNSDKLRTDMFPELKRLTRDLPLSHERVEIMEKQDVLNYWQVFRYVG